MKNHSKRYNEVSKNVESAKTYSLKEAVSLAKKISNLKFDSSVDLHFKLNIDPKKTDQLVRGTVALPHGTGKKIRVAVFCKGEHEKIAKEAQADYVGGLDLIEKVSGGFLDFECAISTPEMMKDLSKLGKVLGPRGLMPSPKTGTVTNDIAKAISDVKKGKIEFRVDKQGGIHVSVGRASFDEPKLYENALKTIEAITEAKPSSVKGKFISSLYLSSTMSPGLRIEI
ncbi:MAG: 50S ribosomal protein L1 [Candidatus Omnitrophota bacterium]|jgi:large subunit ribosomal protein L1|nr:MAG: 50S ribosomal protein L1 [Candidatus Omnitrophota bacterium]